MTATQTVPQAVHDFPFADMSGPDPAPALARIAGAQPVARITTPTGVTAWLLSRPEDVRAMLADPRFSRAAYVADPSAQVFEIPQVSGGMAAADGADHARLRRLVASAFTTRRVEDVRPFARDRVGALLDEVAGTGAPADLVPLLATPLPVMAVCQWIGVPYADRQEFFGGTETLLNVSAYSAQEVAQRRGRMVGYLVSLLERKRREPGDDLLSALAAVCEEGERLTPEELVGLAVFLLGAGLETTAQQICVNLLVLLREREQWDLLVAEPDRVPDAVEELLRYAPTVPGALPRLATEDVVIGGVTVRAGEVVMAALATPNRRAAGVDRPDAVDVTRPAPSHLAFGHGMHRCLGAPLARVVLQEALWGLVRRFPGLRLAVPDADIAWREGHAARGPVRLPVTW
ncbi:cytochrome P450 [Streptomyces sp. PTM05]|uniref:Cytochrome P450 n=1 Tax=Streptantibioticus parmotrematis TaxID=2873249 RepID=A0ABS7QKD4_9ACTN|nr:cytochrome P450 [Streptantibioticus parmotrematis]MBY8883600.1 cytochrome P450 [Streptantibioticus parmotrematis]